MPKAKYTLARARHYQPNDIQRGNPGSTYSYAENVNFVTAQQKILRSFPAHELVTQGRANAGSGIGTGTVAPVQEEDVYVYCEVGETGRDIKVRNVLTGDLVTSADNITNGETNIGGTVQGFSTVASDGENAYVSLGWGEDDDEGMIPKRVGKRHFGRLVSEIDDIDTIAEPTEDYHIEDAILVKPDPDNILLGLPDYDTPIQAVNARPGDTGSVTFYTSRDFDTLNVIISSNRYFFKVCYVYDGYQEGPLTDILVYVDPDSTVKGPFYERLTEGNESYNVWEDHYHNVAISPILASPLLEVFRDPTNYVNGIDTNSMSMELGIVDMATIPGRVSGINIYGSYADVPNAKSPRGDGFRLVQHFDLTKVIAVDDIDQDKVFNKNTWETATGKRTYKAKFEWTGDYGNTFEERTSYNETVEHMDVRYQICASVQGKLFAAGIWNPTEEFNENLILISEFERFSVFDWLNKRMRTKHKATAITEYYGDALIFEEAHTYVVDVDALVIRNEWEGIGCSSPQSVVYSDRGLFFCNRKNMYWAQGNNVEAIGRDVYEVEDKPEAGYSQAYFDETQQPAVVYDTTFDLAIYLFQSGTDIYGWCFSPIHRTWLTSIRIQKAVLYSAFSDYKGNTYIMTDKGIHKLFGDADHNLPWQLNVSKINFNRKRYKMYDLLVPITANEDGSKVFSSDGFSLADPPDLGNSYYLKIEHKYDGGPFKHLENLAWDDRFCMARYYRDTFPKDPHPINRCWYIPNTHTLVYSLRHVFRSDVRDSEFRITIDNEDGTGAELGTTDTMFRAIRIEDLVFVIRPRR